jgi:hypothetical protein
MSKYISTVRFLVKEGSGDEFIARHTANFHVPEVTTSYMVKTGERTFAFVAIFESEQHLIDARPQMIESLNLVRDLLEEISPELGFTDPVSGPVVFER